MLLLVTFLAYYTMVNLNTFDIHKREKEFVRDIGLACDCSIYPKTVL